MIEQLFGVRDKIVLVTGAGQGLGFTLARGFARCGARVVLNDVDRERLDRAVKELQDAGGAAAGRAFDVAQPDEVQRAVQDIEKHVGPIAVLVNNAGIHRRAPLEEMSLGDWQKVLDVNLTSAFIVARAVVQHMKSRRQGRIINITSLNAEMARPTIGNYCAAKGGLKMLTKAMATEWGQYNINVNAIGPGYFLTDLTRKLAADPAFDAWVKKEVPLARWGDPDELVGTALYLASPASSYVNGFTVYVDGGWQACL
jgi:gluconate 5-dehydrogenase